MKKSCKSDVITRIIASFIIFLSALMLIFVLGFNNSSQSSNFPTMLNNCTVMNFGVLDPNSLKRSTNIFSGAMFGAIIVGLCYQVFVIAGRFLKLGFIDENHRYWGTIDIIISTLFMSVLIATVCGSYVLGYLRNQYKGLFREQLSSTRHFDVATGFLFATFGIGISGIYQAYNIALMMTRLTARKCSDGKCSDEDKTAEDATELSKPQ